MEGVLEGEGEKRCFVSCVCVFTRLFMTFDGDILYVFSAF